MPLDPSLVGRTYPPTEPYEVSREKIREFAEAINDPNPVYSSRAAAQQIGHPDVIAPPTFAIVVTSRAARQIVEDPDLGIDYSRVVHGEQRFVHARPIHAGELLQVVVSVEGIRAAAGNDLVTSKAVVSTVEGELVCTAYSTLVARGTA
jgi:acyl dehydratase